ncbi:MAG: antitoxin [Candidatus Omnitrophica bacterium]|nr:antitoxin [Candidatus Omnitrophota bacterium]
MKRMKLRKWEREIEEALLRGEYVLASEEEHEEIRRALAKYRKESVLNMRINTQDLKDLKRKAKKLGVKYQTFIAEILHRFVIR